MSTEQSVDPELVEQTKQQIRNLVREIAVLSKSEMSPLEFYDALLNRIVTALAAVGGAVWTRSDTGRIELEYQINLRETRLIDSEENQATHGRLLNKAFTSGEGMLVAPHSGAGDEEEGGNPTDYLLVVAPLKSDQDTHGIVEVFQRPGGSPTVQRGYLRFLLQMCELAGDYLKTRRLRHFTDRQTLWAQLETFTRMSHRSLDPRLTAYTIANEGRRLIECDRVSVAIKKGKKCKIESVSGQDTFDARSNVVVLLGKLATAVAATGETVWYTGDTSLMAPQVEEAIHAYVDEAHSKAVGIIPLKRPKADPEDKEPSVVVGALIVEQIEDSQPKEGLMHRVDVVSEHSATALANALEYHSLFLMPVWRALGKASWVLRARTLPKTLVVLSLVAALGAWLALWPADFQLEGKGTLQPVERRDVFAAESGVVDDVLVDHGQLVKKGDPLVVLRNTDLDVKFTDTLGQQAATGAQLAEIEGSLLSSRRTSPEERERLLAQQQQLKQQFRSLTEQLKLLRKKQEQLTANSPIDGKVITWQVRELLNKRPVQQGQRLLSVADPDKQWELELRMPEDRMGHIAQAQRELDSDPEAEDKHLPVTYILATDPGVSQVGKVVEIQGIADPHNEEGNTVLIRVQINKHDIEDYLRPGATVTAKVHCGRAPIGYVWFHDLIAFIQSKILFRL